MKLYQLLVSDNIHATILYLIIMFASIDYSGVLDYALKAIIGSAAWFLFRILGDYFSAKIKRGINHTKQDNP